MMLIKNCLFLILLTACTSHKPTRKFDQVSAKPIADTQTTNQVTNFSGDWEVDYKLTENPQEKLAWLYEVTRSQAEQKLRAAQGRGGSTVSRSIADQAIDQLSNMINLGSLAASMTRSTVLNIEQSVDHIVIKRDGDYNLVCDFGTKPTQLNIEWCGFNRNGDLTFITKLPEGLTITYRLILSQDQQRLSLTTMVHTRHLPQSFTLSKVYMPYEKGKHLYHCKFTLKKKKTCWLQSTPKVDDI